MKIFSRVLLLAATIFACPSTFSEQIGDDILLIINYNFEHYGSVSFLTELYKPYFPHIVFYGPRANGEVNFVDHFKGCYSYNSIIAALQKYPGYAGYLWIHDDVLINPWMLARLDKTKIWTPELGFTDLPFNGIASLDNVNSSPWIWWRQASGYPRLMSVYAQWASKYKDMLAQNIGPNNAAIGYSDILYLPAQYAQDFITLATACRQGSEWYQSLFLEIAMPTIMFCLAPKEEIIRLNGIQLQNDKRHMAIQDYSKQLDYIHPFKWSDHNLQTFVKKQWGLSA